MSNPTTLIVGDEKEVWHESSLPLLSFVSALFLLLLLQAVAGYLALDFGRIFASNSFSATPGPTGSFPEHIELVIQDLAWRTRTQDSTIGERMLLDRFNTTLALDRDEDATERRMHAKLELSEMAMRFSDHHMAVLTDIVAKVRRTIVFALSL